MTSRQACKRTQFRQWLEYFGKVFGVVTVAVPPHYTSQNCSNCDERLAEELFPRQLSRKVVKKSLSIRTHVCTHCGHIQDRDWNAARNILELGLRTVGHTGTSSLELGNASGETDQYLGEPTPPSAASLCPEVPSGRDSAASTRGKRKPKS